MSIKFLCTLIILAFLFSSPSSMARKPTLSSLNHAINTLKKQNNTLKSVLQKQDISVQDHLKKVSEQQLQIQQELERLQQQLQAQEYEEKQSQNNDLLYLLGALSFLAFILSIFSLRAARRKPKSEVSQITPRLDQTEADLIKLSGQAAQQHHALDSLKVAHDEQLKTFGQKLRKLDSERKQSHERRQAIEKELKYLLQQLVSYEAIEADRLILSTMLEEGNLHFDETLQAKSLLAEYQNQWQLAIVYWETLLAEKKDDPLALLHIGYANYKLAENHREDEYYLVSATNTYHKIMQSAPEYFEDINGYDDDENMGASENVNDPEHIIIYQQIEQLIMKVDELKNYYSIYNLACQYAKEGNTEAAKDWLEQINLESNTLHCKHLQEDKDLDTLRKLTWFQQLLKESCEEL